MVPLTVTVSVVLYPAWPWCAEREIEIRSSPATAVTNLAAFRTMLERIWGDYIIAVTRESMLRKGYLAKDRKAPQPMALKGYEVTYEVYLDFSGRR